MSLHKGQLPAGHFHRGYEHTTRLHAQRAAEPPLPPDLSDPELAAVWRSAQLHWLASVPAYRELIRQRVSEAARRAEKLSRRIDREHRDVDYLGRDVDGCG